MVKLPNPSSRIDRYMHAIATGDSKGLPDPKSRQDKYLYYLATQNNPATIHKKVFDFIDMPQGTKPSKGGALSNGCKILHKREDKKLSVIQPMEKGYVHYTLERGTGASVPGRDYGGNHDLLRVTSILHANDVYVYRDIENPKAGAWDGVQYAPSQLNTAEMKIINSTNYSLARSISSKNGALGFGCYKLNYGNYVEFEMETTDAKRANLLFLATASSSTNIEIYVEGMLRLTFNPKKYYCENAIGAYVIDFDVPSYNVKKKYTVKILNASTSGTFYGCALNFYKLKDYKNSYITDYKMVGSLLHPFIDNNGASDYAFVDADNNLILGSHHGGETLIEESITWNSDIYMLNEYSGTTKTFEELSVGSWCVSNNATLYQHTNLGNKAEMISWFNFNIDGTIDMDFSFQCPNGFNTNNFYTALTCTHSFFNEIIYPVKHTFDRDKANNDYYHFDTSEGKISQYNPTDNMQMDIRFTKFNHSHNSRRTCIADNDIYRKFYYGPVYTNDIGTSHMIKNITFSKSLDFYVR